MKLRLPIDEDEDAAAEAVAVAADLSVKRLVFQEDEQPSADVLRTASLATQNY